MQLTEVPAPDRRPVLWGKSRDLLRACHAGGARRRANRADQGRHLHERLRAPGTPPAPLTSYVRLAHCASRRSQDGDIVEIDIEKKTLDLLVDQVIRPAVVQDLLEL